MIYDNLPLYERELINQGFDKMEPSSQNSLMNAISRKTGQALWQIKPEDILKYHKDLKISMHNEFCELAIAGGFTSTNGHRYRTNSDDQTNFLGRLVFLLLKPETTEVSWKAEDVGDYVVHTKEEWLQVALEGFAHKEAQLSKFNEKTKLIKAATTHDQVVAISWSGNGANK
ncbi:tail fiber protein [Bacillus phage Spock]|uniref:DUF4376 domain-containing protein n=2 Tax=Bequatrovirus spock TaxID=1918008 RepID=A0A1X9SG24_9CAUD|nr:tail fiber protein [Bacillus phage Spock]AGY48495.1 hypothetical protein Spock_95 [Bacillus phage Spock]ARQ95008.1 hypothetical protein FLAPJACK_95 [Bacillus phage Flapjack]